MLHLSLIMVEWTYLIGNGLDESEIKYIKTSLELNDINVLKQISINPGIDSLCLRLKSECEDEFALDEKVYDFISMLYDISKEQDPIFPKKLGFENGLEILLYFYSLGGTIPYNEYMLKMTFVNYQNFEDIILADMLIDDF